MDDGEGGVGRIVVDVVRAMRRTANEKGPYTTMNKDAGKKTGNRNKKILREILYQAYDV